MSTTSIIILSQVGLLFIVLIVLLALYARRQKKAVLHLQDTLRELKEELSGETLARYLQSSLDDCRTHAKSDSVSLNPEADLDSQALALRYQGLAAELGNLQSFNGELTPLQTALKPYLASAEIYQQHLRNKCDKVRVDAESDQTRLNHRIDELAEQLKAQEQKLRTLRGLTSAFDAFNTTELSKDDIELQLHTALLEYCDTMSNPAPLREIVYLLHEAYQERGQGPNDYNDGLSEPEAPSNEAAPNADSAAMMQVIEQFTEDSADMVERIHLLTNQNKQLTLENEQLKAELTQSSELGSDQEPLLAGMKLKVEQQNEEILALQSRYRDLEDQYLALYEERGALS